MTGYEYCIKNRVTHCPKCDRYYIGMVVFECPHCRKEVEEVKKSKIKEKINGVIINGRL